METGASVSVPQRGQGVDDSERYRFVTSRITHFDTRIIEHFKMYIQVASAIVAGYVWVRTQAQAQELLPAVGVLAPTLLVLLAASMSLLVWGDFKCWWGYRRAESELTHGAAPTPSFPRAGLQEVIMTALMLATASVGAWYLYYV